MKGDFTRSTFDPTRHYSSVLLQQGRVQVDADWNEQQDLTAHRIETETLDALGHCGVPLHDDGFRIVAAASDLTAEEQTRPGNASPEPLDGPGDFYLTAGRAYIEGALCVNERIVPFTLQPDLPGTTPVTTEGTYLAWIDVWPRHLTALEDPAIREVALGGPDHATRVQTVWQVKLFRLGSATMTEAEANCATVFDAWEDSSDVATPTGGLAARAEEDSVSRDPCILAPGAGYRRLENQLYRVEVHRPGALGTATFKWSRDNGSVVSGWVGQSGANNEKLTVVSAGRDKFLNFATGQWVELTDDNYDRLGRPGPLVQIEKVEGNVITVKPSTVIDPATGSTVANDAAGAALLALTEFETNAHPKVRRWDHASLLRPTNTTTWHALEDGVEVRFGVALTSPATFRTGDYWLIPARTATPFIEWPASASDPDEPALISPHGIRHRRCRLGILRFDGTNWTGLEDCRRPFPPATELITLHHVSGDGQEAMPNQALPQPLKVRVSNGQWPVAGREVEFTIVAGGGTLSGTQPVATVTPDGTAECVWTLGNAASGTQRVEARLLDPAGAPIPGQVVGFNANLSLASNVAYDPGECANLSGATNVQLALDRLSQLVHLAYAGGDGQEATPGQPLPQPLRVRIRNECGPIEDAIVRFTASQAGARVADSLGGLGAAANTVDRPTDSNGLAECFWQLDSGSSAPQFLTAELVSVPGSPAPPIAAPAVFDFTANLETPSTGSGCEVTVGVGGDFPNLAEAFKALAERKNICICLLPGEHPGASFVADQSFSLKLTGCGQTSARILLSDRVRFEVGELILRDLSLIAQAGTASIEIAASQVTAENCAFARTAPDSGLPSLVTLFLPTDVDSANLRWVGNRMMSLISQRVFENRFDTLVSSAPNARIQEQLSALVRLDPSSTTGDLETRLNDVARDIAELTEDERVKWMRDSHIEVITPSRTRTTVRRRAPRRSRAAAAALSVRRTLSSAILRPDLLLADGGALRSAILASSLDAFTAPTEEEVAAVELSFGSQLVSSRVTASAIAERLAELVAVAFFFFPTNALALASHQIGGVIGGNNIVGHLLLNASSANTAAGDEWRAAQANQRLVVGEALVLEGNEASQLFTRASDAVEMNCHRSLAMANNIFTLGEGTAVAQLMTLTGNHFLNVASGAVALRPRADHLTVIGNNAGDMKVVIGNGIVGNGVHAANIADIKF